MPTMTLEQFSKVMTDQVRSERILRLRRAWAEVDRQHREDAEETFRKQTDMNGKPWPALINKRFKPGDVGPVLLRPKLRVARLRTNKQAQRANRLTGGGMRVPALRRTRKWPSRPVATQLSDSVSRQGAPSSVLRIDDKAMRTGTDMREVALKQQQTRPFWQITERVVQKAANETRDDLITRFRGIFRGRI